MTTDFDDDDHAILRRLAAAERDSSTGVEPQALSEGERSAESVERTLSQLVEDGLAARADEGRYELTSSGRRLLRTDDEDPRPDVPSETARAIEALDLDPDAEAALFRTVELLRNWGAATPNEIIDGVYSEVAAGYDDGESWWAELISDRLADLPGVVAPADEDDRWRYEGDDAPTDSVADGRRVFDDDAEQYGSARHVIEREAATEAEAEALSAAFEALAATETATTDELADASAEGTNSMLEFDRIMSALEAVPGVERDGETWRYVEDDRFWGEESNGA